MRKFASGGLREGAGKSLSRFVLDSLFGKKIIRRKIIWLAGK